MGVENRLLQSTLASKHYNLVHIMPIVKQLIVTVLLLFTEKCCGTTRFSQSLYDIFIDRGPIYSSEAIGRVEVMKPLTERACYWINNSSSLNQVITVDPETGEIRLSPAFTVDAKSFEAVVYASTGGCSSHAEAEAKIRVQVSCVLGSYLWNKVPECTNAYAPCATKHPALISQRKQPLLRWFIPVCFACAVHRGLMCNFDLQPVKMVKNVETGKQYKKPRVIPLVYRIEFRQYGCIPKALVTCHSTQSISLQDMIVAGIGSDMKCPIGRNQSASCGTTYIGRTSRRLSQRVREHHPAWLNTGVTKSITSAFVSHLPESNNTVNVISAFHPVYHVRVHRSKLIPQWILATAEAVGIRLYDPPLYAKKQFVKALGVPWPSPPRTNNPSSQSPDPGDYQVSGR